MSSPLTGEQWAQLESQDAAAYNQLFPKFNANVAWAGAHCIAKPTATAPAQP